MKCQRRRPDSPLAAATSFAEDASSCICTNFFSRSACSSSSLSARCSSCSLLRALGASLATALLMTRSLVGLSDTAGLRHPGQLRCCSSHCSRQVLQKMCSSSQIVWASSTSDWQMAHEYSSSMSSRASACMALGLAGCSSAMTSAADGLWWGSFERSLPTMAPSLALCSLEALTVWSTRSWLKAKMPTPHRDTIDTPVRSSESMHPTAHMSSLLV
mmetsp:Transcript_22745/g.57542  ORF Transcript_22745/g.57542 Transcript_22745/m.57542 type:complete len:216 (-) Transcript_22745:2856-3503(-)